MGDLGGGVTKSTPKEKGRDQTDSSQQNILEEYPLKTKLRLLLIFCLAENVVKA